uniref:GSKIP domain-containing protein n=1 Tax=Amblyomma maculatum TaxID=34609 RepID=G3MMS4_AMBMU
MSSASAADLPLVAPTTPDKDAKASKSPMEPVSASSKTFQYGIVEVPYQDELKSIIEEIRFGVGDVSMSSLPSDGLASYFNLQTKEGKRMCVLMSRQGFQVVGNEYDMRDIEDGQCYETINALLDSLSPAYRQLFSEALTKKLQELQTDQQRVDEKGTEQKESSP